ncbi:thaumatin, partial [Syncephalastrum racemosum]
SKKIDVKNQCKETVSVGVLTNGKSANQPEQSFDLTPGSSQSISKDDHWGGRVWGRHQCSGGNSGSKDCGVPGAGNPASLAEFFFKGSDGKDFYDISLVDGYNLQMSINVEKGEGGSNGKYNCGSPSCKVPDCPKEYAIVDSTGNVVSCQSSCSKHNDDQTCCKGSHDDPSVCKPDQQASAVKKACPDAYSFAYDDQSSTYQCNTDNYEVVFC